MKKIPRSPVITPPICNFSFSIKNSFYITICIFPIYKLHFTISVNGFSCMLFTFLEKIPCCSVIIPPVCKFSIFSVEQVPNIDSSFRFNSIFINDVFVNATSIFSIYKVFISTCIFSNSCKFFTILEKIPCFSVITPPISYFTVFVKNSFYITICILSFYELHFSVSVNCFSCILFTVFKEIPSSSIIIPPVRWFCIISIE